MSELELMIAVTGIYERKVDASRVFRLERLLESCIDQQKLKPHQNQP
jgi:hypothetical protein